MQYSNLIFQMTNLIQTQSIAVVLQNRCSYKFRKFNKKIPVLESLFNKESFVEKKIQRKCFPVTFVKLLQSDVGISR